ncbi:MAG: tRNA 4-thiouridine(8) synthase ThiI [Candidatus Saccharicenans sp.]
MRLKEVRPPAEKKARARALLLLSGGLDSILAGKVLEEQGVEIVGLSFSSLFFGPREAVRAAEEHGWPLVIAEINQEEIEIVEHPRYGYGRNMNPCIDCHGQMVRIAGQLLERYQADFVATGEVLGERPKSQNRQALELVEKLGQLKGLVLRPLSAKLLPPTRVEQEGLVDREKLLDISGRSRKRQLELAAKYGLKEYPTPAGGCLLTDPGFSQRLKNLLNWRGRLLAQDIWLIRQGRLFFQPEGFFVIGRNEQENERLRKKVASGDIMIALEGRQGPLTVLRLKDERVPDDSGEQALKSILNLPAVRKAAILTVRYSKARQEEKVKVAVSRGEQKGILEINKEEWTPFL